METSHSGDDHTGVSNGLHTEDPYEDTQLDKIFDMMATFKVKERDTDVATAIFATPTELGSLRVALLGILLCIRAMTPILDTWKQYVWVIVQLSFGLLGAASFCVEAGIKMGHQLILVIQSVYCIAAILTLAASVFSREFAPCLLCLLIHYVVVPKIRFPVGSVLALIWIHTVIMYHHIAAIIVAPYYERIRIDTWEEFWNLVLFFLRRIWIVGRENERERHYVYQVVLSSSVLVWASCQLKNIIETYFPPSKDNIDSLEEECHRWGPFGRWTSVYEV